MVQSLIMQDAGTTEYNDMWDHDYGPGILRKPMNHDLEKPSPRIQSSDLKEIPRDEYKTLAVTLIRHSLCQKVVSIWYKSPWI